MVLHERADIRLNFYSSPKFKRRALKARLVRSIMIPGLYTWPCVYLDLFIEIRTLGHVQFDTPQHNPKHYY